MIENKLEDDVRNTMHQKITVSVGDGREFDINVNIFFDDHKSGAAKKTDQQKVKIVTKLSVTQLAYLFRVLYQMKRIKAVSQTQIMRFIAETFETNKVSEISSKSLRSKYYKVTDSEKSATRKQLEEIIEFIDNDRKNGR